MTAFGTATVPQCCLSLYKRGGGKVLRLSSPRQHFLCICVCVCPYRSTTTTQLLATLLPTLVSQHHANYQNAPLSSKEPTPYLVYIIPHRRIPPTPQTKYETPRLPELSPVPCRHKGGEEEAVDTFILPLEIFSILTLLDLAAGLDVGTHGRYGSPSCILLTVNTGGPFCSTHS